MPPPPPPPPPPQLTTAPVTENSALLAQIQGGFKLRKVTPPPEPPPKPVAPVDDGKKSKCPNVSAYDDARIRALAAECKRLEISDNLFDKINAGDAIKAVLQRRDYLDERKRYTQPAGFDEIIYAGLGEACKKNQQLYAYDANADEDRLAIVRRLISHPEITTLEQYLARIRTKPCIEDEEIKRAKEAAEKAVKAQENAEKQLALWQKNGPQRQLLEFWTRPKGYIQQQRAKYRPGMTLAEQSVLAKRILRDVEMNLISDPWRKSFGSISALPPYWTALKETGHYEDPFTKEKIDFDTLLPGWNYVSPTESMTLDEAMLRIKELEELTKMSRQPGPPTPEQHAFVVAEQSQLQGELEATQRRIAELETQLAGTTCSIKANRIRQELEESKVRSETLLNGLYEVRDILENKFNR